MKLIVEKGDLFKLREEGYYMALCISSDIAMGAGIAKVFDKKYGIKEALLSMYSEDELRYPKCIRYHKIFNLITKAKYSDKPSYKSLEDSLIQLREYMIRNNIDKVATYKLGCCRDKLKWENVSAIIESVFRYTDIEFRVRYLEEDNEFKGRKINVI